MPSSLAAQIHQPLHHEHTVRAPGAAHRGDHHRLVKTILYFGVEIGNVVVPMVWVWVFSGTVIP